MHLIAVSNMPLLLRHNNEITQFDLMGLSVVKLHNWAVGDSHNRLGIRNCLVAHFVSPRIQMHAPRTREEFQEDLVLEFETELHPSWDGPG